MDNLREKLVKLLCEASSLSVDAELFEDSSYAQQLEIEADFLIANGVTVQRWIPVTERLPEESGEYLAYCGEYDGICVIYYEILKTKSKWRTNWKEVTHWMPLPEPPKEVE